MATTPQWIERGFKTRPAGEEPAEDTRARREERIRYQAHRPLDRLVVDWIGSWILTPIERHPELRGELLKYTEDYSPVLAPMVLRIRRAKIWLVGLYPRGRSFLSALLGPRVGTEILSRRGAICELCPFLRIRLPGRQGGRVRRYCGSCGCPEWPLAELQYKNRLERWICPRGLHPRPPDWREELIRNLEGLRLEAIEAEQSRRDNGNRGNDLAIDDGTMERGPELDERDPKHRGRTDGRAARSAVKG